MRPVTAWQAPACSRGRLPPRGGLGGGLSRGRRLIRGRLDFLRAGRCGGAAGGGVGADAVLFEKVPQRLERGVGIAVVSAAADAPEAPAAALELPLAGHVRVVAVL